MLPRRVPASLARRLRPVLALAAALAAAAGGARAVEVAANSGRLPLGQVLELTFRHDDPAVADPTWDVVVEVDFARAGDAAGPVTVEGFFWGSSQPQEPGPRAAAEAGGRRPPPVWPCDPADTWKARFRPGAAGEWTYAWRMRHGAEEVGRGGGAFTVVEGRVPWGGPLRVAEGDVFRIVDGRGRPLLPVGWQDCAGDENANGFVLDSRATEGPFRLDRELPGTLPPGPAFARGPGLGPTNGDHQFGLRARAGFNLFRYSPDNCSPRVFADPVTGEASLDHVRWEQARMVDEVLQMAHRHGVRIVYGLFGYLPVHALEPDDAAGMARVRRLVRYSVARWGAYADIWEPLNEQNATDAWYGRVLGWLREADPYGHLVTSSWSSGERARNHAREPGLPAVAPRIAGLDVEAPHRYGSVDERHADRGMADFLAAARRHGRPVLIGEAGNGVWPEEDRVRRRAQGYGGVWDPSSARRMRAEMWTAVLGDSGPVYWETSYAKDGHFMNLWVGARERQQVRALRLVAPHIGGDAVPAPPHARGEAGAAVRLHGVRSADGVVAYLVHWACAACAAEEARGGVAEHRADHRRGAVEGLRVGVDVPEAGSRAVWYRPEDGSFAAVETRERAGWQDLAVPPFEVDLALLVVPPGRPLPDADGDGLDNGEDPDDDGDGVADEVDAFPLGPEDVADVDGDEIEDRLDADVGGDGVADGRDTDGDGVPDHEDEDLDGDGVPQRNAVPWDARPWDPAEWRDTDGDGVGDGADADDDGDGWSDAEEEAGGSDPRDPAQVP